MSNSLSTISCYTKHANTFPTSLELKACRFYVISGRYGLSFLGCILTIGGTFLFVAFGPNSHEKLKAENIVTHVVGLPVLLYLVRYILIY